MAHFPIIFQYFTKITQPLSGAAPTYLLAERPVYHVQNHGYLNNGVICKEGRTIVPKILTINQ
jgi:hypothetical protein